jgi:selenocysteine lyase/cysteine desulfurase
MPERLEAGTLNGHGIAGLLAGLTYLEKRGVKTVRDEVLALAGRFETAVRTIPGVRVYGGHAKTGRTGIVALNIADADSAFVADLLNVDYGVCTRAGAHCAPLMHEALGTDRQGAVRFSFSHFNTEAEVDAGIAAIAEIAG